MRPRTAYLLSVFVFGAAGLVRGFYDVFVFGAAGLVRGFYDVFVFGAAGLVRGFYDVFVEGQTLGVVAVLGGGIMVAVVGYNLLRPDSFDGPDEWGLLVYLMVAGSLLFVLAVVWELL